APRQAASARPVLPTDEEFFRWRQALRDLIRDRRTPRRWTLPVLERLEVGWDAEAKRYRLPIRDRHGRLVNVMGYRPGAPDKMRSINDGDRDFFPGLDAIAAEAV